MYIDKEYFLTKLNEEDLAAMTGKSDENLNGAIADAMDVCDTFLRNIYVVPLAVCPKAVQLCCYYIAVHVLQERVQYNDIPERVKQNYDEAISILKLIGSGKVSLECERQNNSSGGGNSIGSGGIVFASNGKNYFSSGSF